MLERLELLQLVLDLTIFIGLLCSSLEPIAHIIGFVPANMCLPYLSAEMSWPDVHRELGINLNSLNREHFNMTHKVLRWQQKTSVQK